MKQSLNEIIAGILVTIGIGVAIIYALDYFGIDYMEPISGNVGKPMPIDYLEFDAHFIFKDIDDYKKTITATYGNPEQRYGFVDPLINNGTLRYALFIDHQSDILFAVSIFQTSESGFATSIDSNGNFRITGLEPISEKCLNSFYVCFMSQRPLVIIIHEFDDNLKVIEKTLAKLNPRITNTFRQGSDTYIVFDADKLMPFDEKDHYIVPTTTLFIDFEQKVKDPCFLDDEPRLCNLEQKVLELEKNGKN